MIKLFLLAVLFSAAYPLTLNDPHSFGLSSTQGEPLELIKLETKATAEGPYVEIEYTFLYKNPFNHTIQTKFVFPPTENAVFHKFEAIIQNQTLTAKVVENPANTTHNNTEERNHSDASNFLDIPAQETVHIIFAMIQPLRIIFNKFYELKLPAFTQNSPSLLQWDIQIELKANSPFVILSNPTHRLPPQLSEQPSPHAPSNKIYKAFWNVTITPNQDFIVYFGPEDPHRLQAILATHPQDPNEQILMLHTIPDMEYVTAEFAQSALENNEDGLSKIMEHVIKQGLSWISGHCLFIIDRSDSMKGPKIESLKQKLKILLKEFLADCGDFNILSFGSTFELYSNKELYPFRAEDVQNVIEWVDTIDADMGGSDLLKALQYAYSSRYDGWWQDNFGGRAILLTDGDISHPDQVIKHGGYDIVIGIGNGNGTSEDIIKLMAGGDSTRYILENEDLRGKILSWSEGSFYEPGFEFQISMKCYNVQKRLVYKEEKDLDDSWGPILTEWFYLSNLTNLKSCKASVLGLRDDEDDSFKEEIQVSGFKEAQITGIWHKLASDKKIKNLEKWFNTPDFAEEQEIINLSLQSQILSQFTSLVLQTESMSLEAFFDLSKWNHPMGQTDLVIPENYIPLDSIQHSEKQQQTTATLSKSEHIDL